MRRTAIAALLILTCFPAPLAGEGNAQVADLPVMGEVTTTYQRFLAHVSSKNADLDEYYARRLYDLYVHECATEGVSPLVALSQMIHETDYLLFSGSVRPTQYNYAGMGSTATGVAGINFGTMERGVRAHVQHLKAYGSTDPLVEDLVDPRFGYVVRGSARTVMALSGRWATDPLYGEKLLAHAQRMAAAGTAP